jgi:uncharacterized protein
METRSLITRVELREEEAGGKTLMGRAVVYNSWSEPIYGAFRERLLPGCFDESLGERDNDIIGTVDHDPCRLLGRTSSGTLKLNPGPEGIDAEVSLPDISYARDLAVSVQRTDIKGMSFIFDVVEDDWGIDENGGSIRTVKKAKIHEVSWVVFPAYPATSAGIRGGFNPSEDPEVRSKVLARMEAALGKPKESLEVLSLALDLKEKE